MKKKFQVLWLALVAMLCVPVSMQADVEVTFNLMHNGEIISSNYDDEMDGRSLFNVSISIYENGTWIAGGSLYNVNTKVEPFSYIGTCKINLSDEYAGKALTYVTNLGHGGEFVANSGSTVSLDCKKATFEFTYAGGEPLEEDGYIYFEKVDSYHCWYYSKGKFVTYLATGQHTYLMDEDNYAAHSFDLNEDKTITIKSTKEKTYPVNIVRVWGDKPVDINYNYNIYKVENNGNTERLIRTSEYGYSDHDSPSLPRGTYRVLDASGSLSSSFTIPEETTVTLNYKKVAFVQTDVTSTDLTIQVSNKNQPTAEHVDNGVYKQQSINTTFDRSGKAELYLMSGEYTYTVDGLTRSFTVGDTDTTIDIEIVTVTFHINYTEDSEALKQELPEFSLNGKLVALSDDRTIAYSGLVDSKVTLVTGYNRFGISIAEMLDANKTVEIQLYALRYETNNNTQRLSIINDTDIYNYLYLTVGTAYYLPARTYSLRTEHGYNELILDHNTVINHHYYALKVTVNDTNGEVVGNASVSATGPIETGGIGTDENGVAILQVIPGEYQVSAYLSKLGIQEVGPIKQNTTITDADASTTITVPGYITFSLNDYTDKTSNSRTFIDTDGWKHYVSIGENKARLTPGKTYRINGYHGTTQVSDGCTITLGKLNVTCEGMGVAFPMENWEAVSSYDVIVGSPVRLTAIPVTDDKFQKWTINEKDYEVPVLDFKTSEPETTAKAVFGGMSSAVTRPMMANTTLNSDGRYIYLPAEVEGTARIYTLDGKLTKTIGVVGDQIGIYDLPTGAYVLTMESESGMVNARFLKK